MTYSQAMDYLMARLPIFTRVGAAAYKPGLDTIRALCQALGNPQDQFASVHIAGTNGKGSTSHSLAAILQQAGYKTGLTTSPHLKSFTERIRVNGQTAEPSWIAHFVQENQALIEDLNPSFFEIAIAMAFAYLAEKQVDIAVVEVGMGGRLDSTNIITPRLSLITNIGLDHMEFLGPDLPSIAREKAGIIKAGIPVVISERQPETSPVFEAIAQKLGAPLSYAQDIWQVSHYQEKPEGLALSLLNKPEGKAWELLLQLPGLYQLKNLPGIVEACRQLNSLGYNIPPQAIASGLAGVRDLTGLLGRWQVVAQQPYTVADTAHNAAGLTETLAQIQRICPEASQQHYILGFVRDKALDKVLPLFPPQARYYFTQAQIPRALPVEELKELAASFGLQGEAFANVNQAYSAVRAQARAEDLIYVGGSTFVVAEWDAIG